jgi:hypothetical protein
VALLTTMVQVANHGDLVLVVNRTFVAEFNVTKLTMIACIFWMEAG